ncbi:MAG: diguanylate cyclase [Zoogloea sp.]|nr:diguanylate cyclase [Zoogloea sp.]
MAIDDMARNNRSPQGELDALRVALDHAGALIFSKDSHCRYTYANQRFCELVGATLENVVGHMADEFFDTATATLLHEHDAKILASGQSMQQRETRFFKNSGARHRFLTVKSPIIGPQGEIVGLSGVSIDITESERFEQALKENQQLLDAILNNVDGYIYMKNRDHRYIYVNRASAELFRREPEDVIGRKDSELLPPEVAQHIRASDDLVFKTGKRLASEQNLPSTDGQPRYYWSKKMLLRRPEQPDCLLGFASDITELKGAQAARLRSEARFRTLFDASRDAVVVIRQGRFIDGNRAALDTLGVDSLGTLCQLHPWDVSAPVQPCGTASEALAEEYMATALRLGHLRVEWMLRRRDNGLETPADIVLSAMDLDGEPTLLASVRDLTDRKRYEAKIHQLAFYDALTGLPNRRLFFDRLSQAVTQSRRSGRHGAVIYLDLDNFKPVNDHHGHRAGDLLLQEVARRLAHCLREEDTVARLGGDEFVALLVSVAPDYETTRAYVCEVAERIRDTLAQPYLLALGDAGGRAQLVEHSCSASLGVTLFPPEESDMEAILKLADGAMYRAKDAGRNQIRFAAP